ncbi:Oidioi.mRNA.OKI2018_I69.chr2.g5320.t1.cds [Oikopleura dioica]|uniref:Oidioi.mRNA.OKI2018_I69.chr2.g5320.t1.cds n=1 Tax=Oikopleura dioica TaxID=34765 RepID=A0ABN7T3N7_OIKDI|nr:Oidioi.mRNA.OKI2018_I69.chr2.g5320.t1.cds [Oikopleura dioica]
MKLGKFLLVSQAKAWCLIGAYCSEAIHLTCGGEVNETIAANPIENGAWGCKDTVTGNKIKCEPSCEKGFKPNWTVRPKKDSPSFVTNCNKISSSTKNLSGAVLKCEEKGHQNRCVKAATTPIANGVLSPRKIVDQERAYYDVVCKDQTVKGIIHCQNGKFRKPGWSSDWKNSCAGNNMLESGSWWGCATSIAECVAAFETVTPCLNALATCAGVLSDECETKIKTCTEDPSIENCVSALTSCNPF